MGKLSGIVRNKVFLAVGAGVVAVGAVTASAASLGPLTVNDLGTSTSVIVSCASSGVGIAWSAPTYTSSANAYGVAGGTLTAPNTCANQNYKVTVADSGGVALSEATGSTGATPVSGVPVIFPSFSSAAAANVTITIYE